MKYTLEICTDSVASAAAAQKGGAKRIELCSGLVIGGLSPDPALFKGVRANTYLKIRTLLRPSFGDFCYDEYEFEMLKEEVQMYRELGADGVVIGILRPDGTMNVEQMEELVRISGDMKVTMHRAFDVCKDPYETLEQCVSLGIDTILTSGQKDSAWNGREMLKELEERAKGRIEILAGAGINPGVISKLHEYTGLKAFHMSGKTVKESRMEFRRQGVPMGMPGISEFEIWQTDEEAVREAVKVLKNISGLDKRDEIV